MKIFRGTDIKALDTYTIKNEPIESIALMERVARALTDSLTKRWSEETPIIVFAGPGNNGGDALAVARLLSGKGYKVSVYLFNTLNSLSADCEANRDRLPDKVALTEVISEFTPPILTAGHLVIDGLFGSGLNKPLNGGFAAVVKYINASSATVVSIDLPSGLMCENNSYNIKGHIIQADLTLTLQFPKLSFLFAENEEFVGEWKIIDIHLSKEGMEQTPSAYSIIESTDIRQMMRPRRRFAHKGDFGHALLVAGSYGMAGASILASQACLRSGVGKLTTHVPARNAAIVQTAVPEAMLEIDSHERFFATPVEQMEDYSAVGIGPGLGQAEETDLILFYTLNNCQAPLVLDADALNILAQHRNKLMTLPAGTILTPHPKELERLIGKNPNSYERLGKAAELAASIRCYIVLKGAWTAILTPDKRCFFNPTGNVGMATAGSGDVLTGILVGLLAQGYSPEEACLIGTYVHGMAGDIAAKSVGTIGMTAGDIVRSLPEAWNMIEKLKQDK